MRETVEAYERRTGESYDPPDVLLGRGDPLEGPDACPTLFRYPGPVGLKDYFIGAARSLAPRGRDWSWFAAFPEAVGSRAVEEFGMVAVLEPLRLQPCPTDEAGVFVAAASLPADRQHLWVPPDEVADRGDVPWDAIDVRDAAVDAIGDRYHEARRVASRRLDAYLEELSALARAGVESPEQPWCDIEAGRRRQIIDSAGIEAPWTETNSS